jgi:hypothetical protein
MAEGSNRDKVGYKQPPRSRQFRKGQSGNPNGRPRKLQTATVACDSAFDDVLRSELQREVIVTESGKPRKCPIFQVAIRAQTTSAAKGNPIAQREVIEHARSLELRDAERTRIEAERKSEEYQKMLEWRDYRRRLWDAAEANGDEPDNPWPHPDDILFDHAKRTWRIRGPSSEAGVGFYDYIAVRRDYSCLFAEMALRSGAPKKQREAWCEIHIIEQAFYDAFLPLRWQLGEQSGSMSFALACLPMRKLRALIRECEDDIARWEALNPPSPAERRASKRVVDKFKRDIRREAARKGKTLPLDGW